MAGGVAYIRMHTHTHTHSHNALRQCKSSDMTADRVGQAHFYLLNTRPDIHIPKHTKTYIHTKEIFMFCVCHQRGWRYFLHHLTTFFLCTEDAGYIYYILPSAVLYNIVHSFPAFCIYTFQWRQAATKPGIMDVTSAHTPLQQARITGRRVCVCVCAYVKC